MEILTKNRLLGVGDNCPRYRVEEGYTRKTEDVSFLLDQRGDRKMVMGEYDGSYVERLEKNKLRKENEKGGRRCQVSRMVATCPQLNLPWRRVVILTVMKLVIRKKTKILYASKSSRRSQRQYWRSYQETS